MNRGKSGLHRAGCGLTARHGDVTKRATETSPHGLGDARKRVAKVPFRKERDNPGGVKRGNLHLEQHQIGKRVQKATSALEAGSVGLAGRWLEPPGNLGPRGMAVGGP